MKKFILFLSIISLSQAAFSQKKDLFVFADLVKKFPVMSDTTNSGKYLSADDIAAFIRKTYNLRDSANTQRPTGDRHAIYEFHFKDRSNLYILVRPDLSVTEITHRYNYQGRTAEFTSWTAATKQVTNGKL